MIRPAGYLSFVFILLVVSGLCLAETSPNQGFLYGTITEQSGDTHTGFLRWESEEAFWDDLFHSRQQEIPWVDFVDMRELNKEKKKQYYETHGLFDRLAYAMENDDDKANISRLFIVRYGDIEVISIDAEENITVALNDGSLHAIRGYSNDVSSDILVYTGADEPVTFDWDDLAEIRFSAAPVDAAPYAERLYGRVTSTRGNFEGFIQWDNSECTSTDILDTRQQDLAMGDIRIIKRDPGEGAIVTLKDGQVLELSGSNDVDNGNRGVFVETADHGRVTVPWSRFTQVEFLDDMGSGEGRDTYVSNGELTGTVTDTDGNVFSGRFVYDMDEARSHDIFNGSVKDLDYNIRFSLIESITPTEPQECRVVLRSSKVLMLDDDQDTGKSHAGLLLFEPGAEQARYLPWSRVKEIRLTP